MLYIPVMNAKVKFTRIVIEIINNFQIYNLQDNLVTAISLTKGFQQHDPNSSIRIS